MGSYTSRIAWETLRSVDSASAPFNTGVYTPIGGPLIHPSYICKLVNNSNILVTVSIDGVIDIDVAPANSFWLYDEGKMLPGVAPVLALPQGTQIFIKSGTGAGGTGLIYLVTQYILTN